MIRKKKTQVIFKYPLSITDFQYLNLPLGTQILTCQFQNGALQLWALIDPNNRDVKERCIRIIGTGNSFDEENLMYINTIQQFEGSFVWHVFEKLT